MKELLGQIDAYQKKINELRPFGPELLPMVRDYYRVGLTYSSNALEGFSYTISETKILLEDGLTAGGKSMRDAYAVLGHGKAYDYMFRLLTCDELVEKDVLTLHSMLKGSLDNKAVAGKYRKTPCFISGSKHPLTLPGEIQTEMDELFSFIRRERDLYHPVEFAVLIHKKLIFIHPFADGNGRVTRLFMNTSLIQKGFLPVVIPPVVRNEYIQCLEAAHTDDRELRLFIARCAKESQREMLRLLGTSAMPSGHGAGAG